MNKIKLKEEQREKLRIKSLTLNAEFCDSGYLSFHESNNNNNLIENLNVMASLPSSVANKSSALNVNNPILIGKTNDQLSLTEKARSIINGSIGGQFSISFSCTSTPLTSHGAVNAVDQAH